MTFLTFCTDKIDIYELLLLNIALVKGHSHVLIPKNINVENDILPVQWVFVTILKKI